MNDITVYLLDDEPDLLTLLSNVVVLSGLHAQSYTRASCFFDEVKTFQAGSILVLDLHMPEIDGVEVMRRLAKLDFPPALILVSGHDSGVLYAAEKLGRAHNLNILGSLIKPISFKGFRQLLNQFIARDGGGKGGGRYVADDKPAATELRRAIYNDQLILYYQPQVKIADGDFIGVEALVRWPHLERGLIYPDYIIPVATEHGWMGELTLWVLKNAVQQGQLWQSEKSPLTVSINIPADSITRLTLPDKFSELLADNSLDPTRVTMEVTESVMMDELVTSLDILTRLRLKGIGLSIDDFGTGYSSLSQLHRVPFTELKIDRSFVSNMVKDSEARAIVKTCILLGHELNMQVVAEGVEDQRTWDLLQGLGCDVAQGYFIAKPMPSGELLAWAEAWESQPAFRITG